MDDKDSIETLLERWSDAFRSKDVAAIMALYDPDIVTYDVMPPMQFAGAGDNRRNWQSFFGLFSDSPGIEVAQRQVDCASGLACTREFVRVSGTLHHGPFALWLRRTLCLRKTSAGWLIFHSHVSVPADFESGKARFDLQPDGLPAASAAAAG